jgi:arginine/lysine/ornithine decarboxylase
MDQDRTPIFDAITRYIEGRPAYFRIPGHRFERGVSERWTSAVGGEIFRYDLTEAPTLDDLHHPEGAILEAEQLAAEVFGSDRCFFLVNGTTCGNEAMIVSTAFAGQKIAIPRNAHKSVLMGLIISGAEPVYIMPELSADWGIHGGVTPEAVEAAFREHPGLKGVLVVSPTYYGACSDLAGIAAICHAHGAALLVDEAHGAHFYFSESLPDGAMAQGADLCAQSIHKVAGSLTQSSMLQARGGLVDMDRVGQALRIVQSTSPSYLLMTSLDMARRDLAMRGTEMIAHAVRLAEGARARIDAIPGVRCPSRDLAGCCGISAMDPTRLIVSAAELGITGFALAGELYENHRVDLELSDHMNALGIVTYANTQEDMDRLAAALEAVASAGARGASVISGVSLPGLPPRPLTPREAYFSKSRSVPWAEARGRVAGEMLAPYPPGIPAVYPGEVLTDEIWEYIEEFRRRGRHLHGPADGALDTFRVIEGGASAGVEYL